jgi:transcriptional regulator with XRE-family HTH domain
MMWNREVARAVGERCFQARRRSGLSQAELSRHLHDLGVPRAQAAISRLERGMASEQEYANAELLAAIAGLTGVDATWLATGVLPIQGGSDEMPCGPDGVSVRQSWGYYVLFGSRRASAQGADWDFKAMSRQSISDARMKIARSRSRLRRITAARAWGDSHAWGGSPPASGHHPPGWAARP